MTCPPLPPPPPPAYTFPGPPIATGKAKFLGSAWSPGNASINFLNYFNKVTPENAGKWGSAEPTRDAFNWGDLDTAYALAKNNGLPFHFHVLVWGNQQPNWIDELPVEEQAEEIREWFAAVAARYPDIDILEVVNEPLHDPPCTRENGGGGYCDALGGRGTAGRACEGSGSRMALDHQRVQVGQAVLPECEAHAQRLQHRELDHRDHALPADHQDAEGGRPHRHHRCAGSRVLAGGAGANADLSREPGPAGAADLPIHVTELDVDGTEDAVQLAGMQKIFPMYWEHPAVTGITLWGYKQNSHWRNAQGAWLVWSQAGSEGAIVRPCSGSSVRAEREA